MCFKQLTMFYLPHDNDINGYKVVMKGKFDSGSLTGIYSDEVLPVGVEMCAQYVPLHKTPILLPGELADSPLGFNFFLRLEDAKRYSKQEGPRTQVWTVKARGKIRVGNSSLLSGTITHCWTAEYIRLVEKVG